MGTRRRRGTQNTVVVGRWLVVVTLLAFVGLLALVTIAPAAHAFASPTKVHSYHVGWVQTRDATGACFRSPCALTQVAAYRWTGRAWSYVALSTSTRVYVSPYAAGWHWAWTQRTGWVVVATGSLDTGYRCTGPNCPVF